jgi:hypothetical protein
LPYDLYDFIDERERNIIEEWRNGLTQRSKGQLDAKVNMLATAGMELPPKLLAGPIKKTGHIYKLIIHADVMLRPMFCRGPFSMETEFTFLVGAKEIQGVLTPDPSVAVTHREILIKTPKRRVPHAF